jgi:hypothetical protein
LEEKKDRISDSIIVDFSAVGNPKTNGICHQRDALLIFGVHVLWSVRRQGSWESVGKLMDIQTPQRPVF